jgi:hypothetical protein
MLALFCVLLDAVIFMDGAALNRYASLLDSRSVCRMLRVCGNKIDYLNLMCDRINRLRYTTLAVRSVWMWHVARGRGD